MRSLPILAVLLATPTALRDSPDLPVRGVADGDAEAPPGQGFAAEVRQAAEPEFARIAAPAHSSGDPDPPSPASPEQNFAEFENHAVLTPASFHDAGPAQFEPAVLLRPVQGMDAALASASDAAPPPAFAPAALLTPADVGPAADDPAGLIAASALEEGRAPQEHAAPGPAPRIAYQFSDFDRAAAHFADRPLAGTALALAPRTEALAAAAAGADEALDAPMPPRGTTSAAGEQSVFDGDFLIIAAGAVAMPSYEGSDDTAIIPAAGVAGRIGGIGINARAAGMALDLVPDGDGAKLGLGLGPVVRYRTNRSARIKDPVVASLGKLDSVLELGVAASLTIRRPFNGHDQLTIGADVRWDVSGKDSGYIVAPSLSYLTPLSRAQVVGLLVSAEFADGRFAHYNYDVSAAGSVVSGLPAYAARGGLKSANLGVFTARDLSGNLLDGGLALGVGAMFSKLFGSAAETPLTAIRGRRGQWTFGVGLGYVF